MILSLQAQLKQAQGKVYEMAETSRLDREKLVERNEVICFMTHWTHTVSYTTRSKVWGWWDFNSIMLTKAAFTYLKIQLKQ